MAKGRGRRREGRGSGVFRRETGQRAQREPDGLIQSRASIDKRGLPIHLTSSGVVRILKRKCVCVCLFWGGGGAVCEQHVRMRG